MITHRTEITVEATLIVSWYEDELLPEHVKTTTIEGIEVDEERLKEMYPDYKLIEMIKEEESEH